MKYPKPTFLKTASKVRHARRTRTIIAIVCLCLIAAVVLFILKMASMQERYRKDFPQLVGAATATTTADPTPTPTPVPTEVPTSHEETTTSELAPSLVTEAPTPDPTEDTEPTEQDNSVDVFPELPVHFHFHNDHPLQVVPHSLRDQYLDDLKEDLEDYIELYCNDAKVKFYYVNLSSNETMGVNELVPVVPAGSFNIAYAIDYYDQCKAGTIYPYQDVTYTEDYPGNSSYISQNYKYGKHFYLRTLAYYMVAYNDNVALNMIVDRLGDNDDLMERINAISCYVDYSKSVLYTDRSGNPKKGPGRSSCYDLANFMVYLYRGYMNDPDAYQPLVDDLSRSQIPSGFNTAFSGGDDLILHLAGRNDEFGEYTDIAIIDGKEPIVVCISVECDSYDRSVTITADLSTLLARYIDSLH